DPLLALRSHVLRNERCRIFGGAGEESRDRPDRETAGRCAGHGVRRPPRQKDAVDEVLDRHRRHRKDQGESEREDFLPARLPAPQAQKPLREHKSPRFYSGPAKRAGTRPRSERAPANASVWADETVGTWLSTARTGHDLMTDRRAIGSMAQKPRHG